MKNHVLQELSCILCNIIVCGDKKSATNLTNHKCALQVLVQCLGLDKFNMPIFKQKFVFDVIEALNQLFDYGNTQVTLFLEPLELLQDCPSEKIKEAVEPLIEKLLSITKDDEL